MLSRVIGPTPRGFLIASSAGLAASCGAREDADLPLVRALTSGPKHHWFGYYDKLEFDPASRLALGTEVDFEHRSRQADDEIRIGMVDLEDGDC